MSSFEKNPTDAYPYEVKKWIDLYKLSDNITIIGSIAYRIMKQYADIDLLENMNVDEKFNVWDYYKLLCACINRMESSGALFSDIKCGFISKYKDIKKFLGFLSHSQVIDYQGSKLREFVKMLDINMNIKESITQYAEKYESSRQIIDWEEFNEYIRNLYTIHWSKSEFFGCSKRGPSGENILLQHHILSSSLKIDMFVLVNNNWIEISSIHNITQCGKPLNYQPMTQSDIYKSIGNNAEKFIMSPFFGSLYKGLKRIWILSRMKDDTYVGNKLSVLINSDVNNLYLAKSYLESIGLIMINKYPVDFKIEKSNIKWLISHCTTIDFDINYINDMVDKANSIAEIYELKKHISHMVNEYAEYWVNVNSFKPTIIKYLKDSGGDHEFI